jgi:hypothetical protein
VTPFEIRYSACRMNSSGRKGNRHVMFLFHFTHSSYWPRSEYLPRHANLTTEWEAPPDIQRPRVGKTGTTNNDTPTSGPNGNSGTICPLARNRQGFSTNHKTPIQLPGDRQIAVGDISIRRNPPVIDSVPAKYVRSAAVPCAKCSHAPRVCTKQSLRFPSSVNSAVAWSLFMLALDRLELRYPFFQYGGAPNRFSVSHSRRHPPYRQGYITTRPVES